MKNKNKLKQQIKEAKWFGILNYDDDITVSQDLNKLLQETMIGDSAECLIEFNMSEEGSGCYVVDDIGFSVGKTKKEVVTKLKNLINNVQIVA